MVIALLVIARSEIPHFVRNRLCNLFLLDMVNCGIAEFTPSDTRRDCFAFGSQ